MFTRLEDYIKKVGKVIRTTTRGESLYKKHKENSVDYQSQVRQGINMVVKESIHNLLARIQDKPYFKNPKPMGGDPKRCSQR